MERKQKELFRPHALTTFYIDNILAIFPIFGNCGSSKEMKFVILAKSRIFLSFAYTIFRSFKSISLFKIWDPFSFREINLKRKQDIILYPLQIRKIMRKRTLCEKYPYSEFFRTVFSPNAGKYGPEKLRTRTLFTQWDNEGLI